MSKSNSKLLTTYPCSIKQELFAVLILALTLAAFRWKIFSQFNSAFLGGAERDAGLYLWLVQTNLKNFNDWFFLLSKNLPNHFLSDGGTPFLYNSWFQSKAFYPYGYSLAFSDNFLLPALAINCLQKCGVSFAAAWNSLILAATFLSGYLTYKLADKLNGALLPSLLAGIAFMTIPWQSEHLGHPQLQFTFFIPLSCLLLFNYLNRASLLKSVLLGICIAAAFATTAYYAILTALYLALLVLGLLCTQKELLKTSSLIKLAIGVAIGLIPAIPVILPYISVREVFGSRFIYEAYYFAATPLSYFSAPIFNWLYGSLTSVFSHSEAHLFMSFYILISTVVFFIGCLKTKNASLLAVAFILLLTLTCLTSLAVIPNPFISFDFEHKNIVTATLVGLTFLSALFILFKFRSEKGTDPNALALVFLFSGLSCFLISLGPLGNPNQHETAFGIYRVFYEIFPGFNSIRAISRIGIFFHFSLAVCFAFVLSFFAQKTQRILTVFLLSFLLIVLEHYSFSYPIERIPNKPEIFNSIKALPPTSNVLILPYAAELSKNEGIKEWSEFSRLNVNYMQWMLDNQNHFLNGYSGQQTWSMRNLPRKFSGFPDQRSITTLSYFAGLKYVVLLTSEIPNFNRDSFLKSLAPFENELKIIDQDGQGNLLLEYTGEFENRAAYYLFAFANAQRRAKIKFEVKLSNYAPDALRTFIEVHSEPSGEIIETISLKNQQNWQKLEFWLPRTSEHVRPWKLTFHVKDQKNPPKVFLRSSEFVLY